MIIAWASRKLYKPETISSSRDERTTKKTGRRATKRYTTLGVGLVSDFPGSRDRENLELTTDETPDSQGAN